MQRYAFTDKINKFVGLVADDNGNICLFEDHLKETEKLKHESLNRLKPKQNYLRPWWRRKMHEAAAIAESEIRRNEA